MTRLPMMFAGFTALLMTATGCPDLPDDGATPRGCEELLIDADDDGFGGDQTHNKCDGESEFPLVSLDSDGDCNDADPAVHPGASEECDGLDNNCNGETDEGFDADGDGFASCGDGPIDCDDANPNAYPGATQVCNGGDNDCDGMPDEGVDADHDGFTTCDTESSPADCDDTEAFVYPGATEICNDVDDDCNGHVDDMPDEDGDGFTECTGDCDDDEFLVNPLIPERCDGIDNDCDGIVDDVTGVQYYYDPDQDGYGADDMVTDGCVNDPHLWAHQGGDCDNNDAAVYPGATETCDGVDQNCDGATDEGFDEDGDGFTTCDSEGNPADCDDTDPEDMRDLDEDGYSECDGDCADTNELVFPGAREMCDTRDNDCDGAIDEGNDIDGDGQIIGPDESFDADGDGYLDEEACRAIGGDDCNDEDPNYYPGAPERCGDENDYNCDGQVDDDDEDGDGVFACEDCDDSNAGIYPGATEICNGKDDNCDGTVDEGFDQDGDGYKSCGTQKDCADDNPAIHPGADEHCDGVDEDCDDRIDDFAVDAETWYRDLDSDGYGDDDVTKESCAGDQPDGYVSEAGDCDDFSAQVNPEAFDACNGLDENCDGHPDERFDEDLDGWATCRGDCQDQNPDVNPGAVEICANGVDDNCSGLTDEGYDIDGDGFRTCDAGDGADCDDYDAQRNPGAEELCDGVDNNCSGTVDEHYDLDADGYPDAEAPECEGRPAASLDCDDSDDHANPGYEEVCDTVDNDCDGEVDEGLACGFRELLRKVSSWF